jgi:hypothetical protein
MHLVLLKMLFQFSYHPHHRRHREHQRLRLRLLLQDNQLKLHLLELSMFLLHQNIQQHYQMVVQWIILWEMRSLKV